MFWPDGNATWALVPRHAASTATTATMSARPATDRRHLLLFAMSPPTPSSVTEPNFFPGRRDRYFTGTTQRRAADGTLPFLEVQDLALPGHFCLEVFAFS